MSIWTFRVVESRGGSTPRWQRPERGWRALGICAGSVGASRPGKLTDERVCAFRVPSSGIEADGSNAHRSARRLPCVSVSFFRPSGDRITRAAAAPWPCQQSQGEEPHHHQTDEIPLIRALLVGAWGGSPRIESRMIPRRPNGSMLVTVAPATDIPTMRTATELDGVIGLAAIPSDAAS